MRVKDKVVLITGGGSGIGRETGLLMAKEGAKIVVGDVNEKAGMETVETINKSGGDAIFAKLDVSNREQAKQAVRDALAKYGRLDVLINNAGIIQDALVVKMTEEQWDKVVNINLKGPFNCIQAVVEQMIAQGGGVILNISSIVALYGNVGQTNYAATKAGLVGMTKTLAKELGKKNIRVNAIAPGFIYTPMTATMPEKILDMMKEKTPLKRLGTPADVANALLFLASDEASFINGAVISVDGGLLL